jgi:hypothetical protein
MRDYTYFEGGRFLITNIYRSQRFDVDRLDLNWVDEEKPEFIRGFRVIDHHEGQIAQVHGEDADNLIYSMSFITSTVKGASFSDFDTYLLECISSKEYLVSDHPINKKEPVMDEVVH